MSNPALPFLGTKENWLDTINILPMPTWEQLDSCNAPADLNDIKLPDIPATITGNRKADKTKIENYQKLPDNQKKITLMVRSFLVTPPT